MRCGPPVWPVQVAWVRGLPGPRPEEAWAEASVPAVLLVCSPPLHARPRPPHTQDRPRPLLCGRSGHGPGPRALGCPSAGGRWRCCPSSSRRCRWASSVGAPLRPAPIPSAAAAIRRRRSSRPRPSTHRPVPAAAAAGRAGSAASAAPPRVPAYAPVKRQGPAQPAGDPQFSAAHVHDHHHDVDVDVGLAIGSVARLPALARRHRHQRRRLLPRTLRRLGGRIGRRPGRHDDDDDAEHARAPAPAPQHRTLRLLSFLLAHRRRLLFLLGTGFVLFDVFLLAVFLSHAAYVVIALVVVCGVGGAAPRRTRGRPSRYPQLE